MDFVVTCRFHEVVFANLLYRPVLAISHHPKVANLMKDLGLSQYCGDIQTFDPMRLTGKFASLVRNAEEVKNQLTTKLANYRPALAAQYDELFPRDTGEIWMPQAAPSQVSHTTHC